MPNLTIYVPQDLADSLRKSGIPVSLTCQRALRRQVRVLARRHHAALTASAQAAAERAVGYPEHRPAS